MRQGRGEERERVKGPARGIILFPCITTYAMADVLTSLTIQFMPSSQLLAVIKSYELHKLCKIQSNLGNVATL